MNFENKLEVCRKTRQVAIDSLVVTLEELLGNDNPISEVTLRNKWLNELRNNPDIFPDGWYIPPPNGIEMLFFTEEDVSRISAKSIRPPEFWPRDDIYLDRHKGLISLFAGPVDKTTGIIGDFGLTLYFGDDPSIIKHLQLCYRMTQKIADLIKVGMKFSDIYKEAKILLNKNGLISDLSSPTDPAGTNIGHTIPWSYEEMNGAERETHRLAETNWEQFKDMISRKRRFISQIEDLTIVPNMAFTIEPRPQNPYDPSIPMVWFHLIVLIHSNGHKEILAGFDEIFKIAGMEYMLR